MATNRMMAQGSHVGAQVVALDTLLVLIWAAWSLEKGPGVAREDDHGHENTEMAGKVKFGG